MSYYRTWQPRELIVKRSREDGYFCPTCDTEMDWLDIQNEHGTCECGWWYTYKNRIEFKPFEAPKVTDAGSKSPSIERTQDVSRTSPKLGGGKNV